jgi:probable DNA repair protein
LRDGDRKLAPASMIEDWPRAVPAPKARRALDVFEATIMDARPDSAAPPLGGDRTVGGGAATLTDQSACAFRAFAKHRLAANEPESPHDGLAASERGDLVHRVLAGFWQSLPSRTRSFLAGMTAEERSSALEHAADKALARVRARRDGLGEALIALEKRRLVGLASRWLQYEIDAREEFEVKCTEERRALAIGPLSLNGQLDRVDTLSDGSTVVIDYKTGGPSSAKAWLGERPDQPQLPLYLVASEPDARGIAFARIRAGEQRFVSLTEQPGMLPGTRPDEWQRHYPSWPALVDAWRTELTNLAEAFAAGAAPVAPKRPESCRYCGLVPLCRLNERAGAVEDDRSGDEGFDE